MTGRMELLYEIHGDRIPRSLGDWELLEQSIRLVVHGFGLGTDGT